MRNKKFAMCIAAIALLSSACKKGGDTIINNYGTDNPKAPNRTMLKAYGLTDSTQVLRFTYHNNEIGKIKELLRLDSSVPSYKHVILYNSANKPEGYQAYKLPSNVLEEQGTFKLDDQGRITEVIKRKTNGDTIGIAYFQYVDLDYQPTSFSFYNQTSKRFTRYEYYIYDNRGNITKTISYTNDGINATYKSDEVDASGFGKIINPLNQLYAYLVTNGSDYGFSSSATLYFSNYLPTSTRSQSYDKDGKSTSFYPSNLVMTADNNNNPVRLTTTGTGSQSVFFRY